MKKYILTLVSILFSLIFGVSLSAQEFFRGTRLFGGVKEIGGHSLHRRTRRTHDSEGSGRFRLGGYYGQCSRASEAHV